MGLLVDADAVKPIIGASVLKGHTPTLLKVGDAILDILGTGIALQGGPGLLPDLDAVKPISSRLVPAGRAATVIKIDQAAFPVVFEDIVLQQDLDLVLEFQAAEPICLKVRSVDAAGDVSPQQEAIAAHLFRFTPDSTTEAATGDVDLTIVDGHHPGRARAFITKSDVLGSKGSGAGKEHYLGSLATGHQCLIHARALQDERFLDLQRSGQLVGARVELNSRAGGHRLDGCLEVGIVPTAVGRNAHAHRFGDGRFGWRRDDHGHDLARSIGHYLGDGRRWHLAGGQGNLTRPRSAQDEVQTHGDDRAEQDNQHRPEHHRHDGQSTGSLCCLRLLRVGE